MPATPSSAPAPAQFAWATLGNSLITAALIYLLEISFVISFGALVFSGELSSQLPQAIGLFLLGNAVLAAITGVLSSYPGTIAAVQDTPGAVIGIVAVAIVAALPGLPEVQFATVVMMIVVATMLTGALLLALGAWKLGRLIRFLPYPVMGGFLAGTGWLLAIGGVGVMTNLPFGGQWLEPSVLTLWLPGVALAVVIYIATSRSNKPYVFPTLLALAVALFYGLAGLTNTSLDGLRAGQWLFEPPAAFNVWQFPLRPALLAQVDWAVLLGQLPKLIPAAIISVIALLLNTSGLELIAKKDIDLNRELVAAGIGNLAAGPLGGLVGYHAISSSALNHSMSGGQRLVALLMAALVAATIFFGTSLLLFIPKFVLGALLFYLGLAMLIEWVYQAWFKFPRIDFLVIVTILVIIMVSGFLEGILVGLVMAAAMFVVSYSRVSVIKFAFNGREYRSRVARVPQESDLLEAHGARVYILKLEGYIFFGTANSIAGQIRSQITAAPQSAVRYIVLDFSKVSGLDSTGLLSFSRLAQWSQEHGSTLIFTGLTGRAQAQFLREPALAEAAGVRFIPDLDHGLEWCENEVIRAYQTEAQAETDLAAQLEAILPEAGSDRLMPYLQRRAYQPGEYLMKEGEAPDYIYFIESGQVTVQLEAPGKPPVRLETMGGGRTVGELGFYLGTRRTAHVVADAPTVVYTLAAADLKRMAGDAPEAASLFHRVVVLLLSERLAHLTRMVNAWERT